MEGHFKPCFSRRNWLARWVFGWVWLVLCRPSPRRLHSWRRLWLRVFGARIGRGTRIYPDARFWAPWNFSCGEYCILGERSQFLSMAAITLGDRVVVSQEAYLAAATHELETPDFALIARPIRIESRAWIAARAFILPGLTIGEGAVVGAQAVVTRDVAAWTIVAGNPARLVKDRPWNG